MESLLDVEKEETKESASVRDENGEKEKDREIAYAMWSMCLILLGMILAVPLAAVLLGPFLK